MSFIYIATAYGNKNLAKEVRTKLQERGYFVTSRWLDEPEGGQSVPDSSVVGITCALIDIDDINKADVLLLLTDAKLRGTGHHFETGYVAAKNKRLIQVGPITSVFQYLIQQRFETIDELLESGTL